MIKKYILFLAAAICSLVSNAQESTFPVNGAANKIHNYYAFINAKIFVNADETIDNGTLLIKEGKIESVGKTVTIPKDAVVYDLKGKTIYPSFIDAFKILSNKLLL